MSSSQSTNHSSDGRDPRQRELLRVCRIGRAQGLKGEVNVYSYTDEPERRFSPGAQLETRDGEVFTVVRSRRFKQRWIVLFEGVDDRNASEALNDTELYVEADPAEDLADEDAWYLTDLIGLEVRMAPGNGIGLPEGKVVGRVRDVLDGSAQQQLDIEMGSPSPAAGNNDSLPGHSSDSSSGRRASDDSPVTGLIPFVEQLVPEVNPDEGYVTIDPPGGLLPGLG
ncbi:16S rRNA processing protein RimM [Bifidobacterium indicum]|nr:ribosome maturation factor RimM [Bifidobacterium indicum]PXY79944.1 16S rRNA processing protein RimM [Bifidobacterium indicum]